MTPAAHARDAPEDATDLTARVHRGKALGWTVLALLYTVGPLWIGSVLPARSSADNPIGFAALILVCVFSGAAAARGLLLLVSRGPRLVVNRTGIVLHSMVLGTSVLPWSAIEALIVFKTLLRQHMMK